MQNRVIHTLGTVFTIYKYQEPDQSSRLIRMVVEDNSVVFHYCNCNYVIE